MKLVWLPDAQPRPRRLAVGEFDGVHAGHREVIRGADSVLTFEPHPRTVVAPAAAPKLLTTLEQKADLIAALGVDELIVIPFDGSFAAQTAQELIDHILVGQLGATWVSVGENFRFGNKARGDAALLQSQGAFATRVVEMVELEGEIVSSSHIRGLIATGDVAGAARLLGAPFELRGTVVHGDKRGRELGFPTANLLPADGFVTPGHGVYACRATVAAGQTYAAATNIGVRPMFETGRGELIEAYLLDFDDDIYGQPLRLEFLKRLLCEKRFDSVETLIEQMGRDVDEARAIAG